ncbi:MAG: hypothetical protein J0L53_18075 [Spirochaetes bacterium]|nr:hypothetical protein [Spirochaetota bacterium]
MRIFPGLLLFFYCTAHLATTGAAPAEGENPAVTKDNKYKRRVLLTLFVNENHDQNTEYLSATISDAFTRPLSKTGNFTVLNRDSVERYMRTMGISIREIHKAENAVRLGKAVGADVVVVGRYITEGQQVTIEAKAVDIQAGRTSVEDTAVVRTNSLMFDAINELARKMSAPMAEKMQPLEEPPPPAEVVLDEQQVIAEVKKIEEKKATAKGEPAHSTEKTLRFTVRAGAVFGLSLGYTRSVYPIGFGAFLGGEVSGLSNLFFRQEWLQKFELGVFAGYAMYPSKHDSYESLSQIPTQASIGYRFDLPWFGGFALTPLVSAGMDFGKFSNINGTASYRIFAWTAGGRAEYAITERWSIALTTFVLFEHDEGLNYQWVNFFSAGWRW